jgi:hypothetical protein
LHPLRVEDDAAALEALAVAENSGSEAAIEAARKQIDGCYEWLTITALSPREWEALIKAHPPTTEQLKAEPKSWCNQEAFVPALLAECIEGEETAEDWAEFIQSGPVSPAEVGDLVETVWVLHDRSPSALLGKDSTQTDS